MYISAMDRTKFSGVYSFSADYTDSRRTAYYFVWELPGGAFAVQELNNSFQPMAAPEHIKARQFTKNFRQEPSILAMPLHAPDFNTPEFTDTAKNAPAVPEDAAASAHEPEAPVAAWTADLSARLKASAEGHGLAARASIPPAAGATVPADLAVIRGRGTETAPPPRERSGLFTSTLPASKTRREAAPGGDSVTLAEIHAQMIAASSKNSAAQTPPDRTTGAAAPQIRLAYDLEAARKAKDIEISLRETFRQTLLRLKRPKERQAALAALERLAQTTDDIFPAHKHMFRDFGVRLRQNSQHQLALLFCRKAVELAPNHDHAHFNMARVLCSLGMYDEAASHVQTAMAMGGDDPLYFKMLTHIRKEKLQRHSVPQSIRRR